jgi:hypothetical protein
MGGRERKKGREGKKERGMKRERNRIQQTEKSVFNALAAKNSAGAVEKSGTGYVP